MFFIHPQIVSTPPKTKKVSFYPPTKWKSVVEGEGMSKGDIKKDP
jgi:hypothetical protein